MKKAAFLFILILHSIVCLAQQKSDSIEMRQQFGKVYLQHNKVLPSSQLHSLLGSTEEGSLEVNKAKANLAPMYLFSFSGGFLIGWELGTALGGGQPQWLIAAGGVGLVLCAIPFQMGYNKHILKAVKIYNSNLKKIGINKTVMEIGLSKNNLGFEIRF